MFLMLKKDILSLCLFSFVTVQGDTVINILPSAPDHVFKAHHHVVAVS